MQLRTLTLAAALTVALAAACDADRKGPAAGTGTSSPPSSPQGTTPTTPANMGQPTQAQKKEGSNPVQGQVDPKEAAQHRDFQQRGDSAGPKNTGK